MPGGGVDVYYGALVVILSALESQNEPRPGFGLLTQEKSRVFAINVEDSAIGTS